MGSTYLFSEPAQKNYKAQTKREAMACSHATNQKQDPTKTQWEKGCLNMIPNQRQRWTAASDWEPYQAKT